MKTDVDWMCRSEVSKRVKSAFLKKVGYLKSLTETMEINRMMNRTVPLFGMFPLNIGAFQDEDAQAPGYYLPVQEDARQSTKHDPLVSEVSHIVLISRFNSHVVDPRRSCNGSAFIIFNSYFQIL